MQELVSLLPIIGIGLLFWFLIIRPQSKRQKAVVAMQAGLEPGVEVMLTSGIYGRIERIEDDVIWLRAADDLTLKVAKGAVGSVVQPDQAQPIDDPGTPSQEV